MKDKIIEVLNNLNDAVDIITINDLLGLKTPGELNELQTHLKELYNDNILFITKKDKYILYKNCANFKIGKLSLAKKGFGFVVIPKEEDIFISIDNLNGATHDDQVLCEITGSKIKREGTILRILKRDLKNLVGEIIYKDGKKIFDLDDDKRKIEVILPQDEDDGTVDGSKVVVRIDKQITKTKYTGHVTNVLGHKNDPGVDILSIAYKYEIYPEFSNDTMKELENIPNSINETDKLDRTDLTNECIFTIDGDDTKDIDDAISIKYNNGIYTLGVHIADVSYYVKDGTSLNEDAFNRGTSSYLADTVIPMIPHKLSNGICSLNPDTLRLTISCVMDINEMGKVINYDIFPSVIKSRKQMTYKKVNDILMRNIVAPDYEEFSKDLLLMNKLAHILRKEKIERGYIDFDLDENKIIQDESGKAVDIVRRNREDGEKLIEDFMIAANETVASHIYNMNLPFIYRDHDIPKSEKIDEFVNLVKILGYTLKNKPLKLTPKAMQMMLDELDEKKEFSVLSGLLLRSMKKADYRTENIGHFGLASKAYTHFTSPIRRYPDLTVHKCLRKYLFLHDLSVDTIKYMETKLEQISLQSSEREVASVEAEREVTDMKCAEYMESHVGEVFKGHISTITNFGMFIELDNLIEGMVHVSALKGDYFTYIPEMFAMVGKSTKKKYTLGDEVVVKLVGASKATQNIDFELVEGDKDGNTK